MTMLAALTTRAASRRFSSRLLSLPRGSAPRTNVDAGRTAAPGASFSSGPSPDGRRAEAGDADADGGFQEGLRRPHSQSFVREDVILEPGEPVPNERPGGRQPRASGGPYWRPPWKNRAEILSAEDYANRPRVGFSEEFATMRDAMIVLSWMTQEDREGMYRLYCDMMTAMVGGASGEATKAGGSAAAVLDANGGGGEGKTSHEYVVRVVAQRYNVTTSRAAGVIQLQHNEEQLKKDPTFIVRHDVQELVDEKCREHIRNAYQVYGEKDPLQFVEDPLASAGFNPRGEDTSSQHNVRVSDLHDVDALLAQTKLREAEEAKLAIQRHIYVEDVDNSQRAVRMGKETKTLLKMGQKMIEESLYGVGTDVAHIPKAVWDAMTEEQKERVREARRKRLAAGSGVEGDDIATLDGKSNNGGAATDESRILKTKTKVPLNQPASASPYPENNRGYKSAPGTRRPRWKYVAQIIDTQAIQAKAGSKRLAGRAKQKLSGRIVEGNTLVEYDGELRTATVQEVEETSWKHSRDESEFMFKGVKEAWIRRVEHGESGGWGRQVEVNPEEEVVKDESSSDESSEENNGDGETSEGGEPNDGNDSSDSGKEKDV